jgi:hypothetical protein
VAYLHMQMDVVALTAIHTQAKLMIACRTPVTEARPSLMTAFRALKNAGRGSQCAVDQCKLHDYRSSQLGQADCK